MSQQQKQNVKIWTATSTSQAGMMVSEDKAYMIANPHNYVVATKNGVVLTGQSVVINTVGENVRSGGLFVKMNDLAQMFPSNLVTLVPQQIPYPPLGFALGILKDLPTYMALAPI